jgi:CubicO group peptidase (beta-lactamase class C family)
MKIVSTRLSLIPVLLAGVFAQSPTGQDRSGPFIQRLDSAAAEAVKCASCPSFTIGLVAKDGLTWTKSYGYADIGKQLPANAETVYRIGSITKQFTALMLLQLATNGTVHLTDPVEQYVPEIRLARDRTPNAPSITLVQLATHTSGLASE